jgi:hypothetical protein
MTTTRGMAVLVLAILGACAKKPAEAKRPPPVEVEDFFVVKTPSGVQVMVTLLDADGKQTSTAGAATVSISGANCDLKLEMKGSDFRLAKEGAESALLYSIVAGPPDCESVESGARAFLAVTTDDGKTLDAKTTVD